MKFSKKSIPIKQLPHGESIQLTYFTLESDSPGPHVYLQASVHGSEVQGNVLIYDLLEFLKNNSFKGKFTFVPMANPWASMQKNYSGTAGRFNPVSGDNWNRNYTDLTKLSEFKLEYH